MRPQPATGRVTRPLLCLLLLLRAPLACAAAPEPERVVALLPLGKVDPEYLQHISSELQARLNVRVRLEPARELPQAAYYAPRRRWRAEKLLEAIDANPPAGAWKVLAVTEAEISTTKGDIPDWGIAGKGSLGGLSCVVTSHLYKKHGRTREEVLRRLADTAIHEFGHTLGFDHCEEPGCVMADARGKALQSTDRSTGRYCARCIGQLPPGERKWVKQP